MGELEVVGGLRLSSVPASQPCRGVGASHLLVVQLPTGSCTPGSRCWAGAESSSNSLAFLGAHSLLSVINAVLSRCSPCCSSICVPARCPRGPEDAAPCSPWAVPAAAVPRSLPPRLQLGRRGGVVVVATPLRWKKNHGPLAQKPFLHRKHDTIYKKRCLISFSSLERGVYFNTSFLNCHELDL